MAKKTDDQLENRKAFQTLKEDLRAKTTKGLYFFYGEEVFLLHHYFGQLKKLLVEELTESFNFHKLNSENFDLRAFSDAVENLPMMAEHTLVHVDEIDLFKLPESDREKVAEILSDIPSYCTVVFTYETVPWNPDKRMKKFYDVITKYGTIVEFPKQEARDLVAWITRHFAAKGKQISSDLCLYLIEITDGTMSSLAGEIQKICAYSGADTIRRSDIDAVTEPALDALVFRMTDFLGQGNYAAALEELQKLLKMQQDPILILGTIGSNLRRMSAARVLLDNGKGSGDFMKLYGMGDYAARRTMDAARRFQPSFYKKAAALVLETDHGMKTSFDDPKRLLELLILQLAQEAQNG